MDDDDGDNGELSVYEPLHLLPPKGHLEMLLVPCSQRQAPQL